MFNRQKRKRRGLFLLPRFEKLTERIHWGMYPFLAVSMVISGVGAIKTFASVPDPGAIMMVTSAGGLSALFFFAILQNIVGVEFMSNKQWFNLFALLFFPSFLVGVFAACCLPLFPSDFLDPDPCGKPLTIRVSEWLSRH